MQGIQWAVPAAFLFGIACGVGGYLVLDQWIGWTRRHIEQEVIDFLMLQYAKAGRKDIQK
jgi:hypothetical protein